MTNYGKLLEEAERLFEIEYRKAYAKVKTRDPTKRTSVARRIAKRKVNEWLEKTCGLRWENVAAKVLAEELDFSLEDLAT